MSTLKPLCALALLAALGGCSGEEYKCPIPNGAGGCRSVDRVYQDTQDLDNVDTPSAGVAPAGQDGKESKSDSVSRVIVAAANAPQTVAAPGPGTALLSAPHVLRLLITPWPDADGDLEAGGYIYLRLDRGEWTIP
jgi:conjugal transfer pilus assembly protein TraV